jgi:formate hydrogenlyase subunit 3/multisubunit Na+/H+ antiporter MnhD subunit
LFVCLVGWFGFLSECLGGYWFLSEQCNLTTYFYLLSSHGYTHGALVSRMSLALHVRPLSRIFSCYVSTCGDFSSKYIIKYVKYSTPKTNALIILLKIYFNYITFDILCHWG